MPWLLFEAGMALGCEIKVIPLRYQGLQPDQLPAPLANLQSVDLCDIDQLVHMLSGLGKPRSRPDARSINRAAGTIARHFRRCACAEQTVSRRLLRPLKDRVSEVTDLSDTQKRLFHHIRRWTRGNRQWLHEEHIRKEVFIAYDHYSGKGPHRNTRISPSEYYYRLRELYFLGLIDMKKVAEFENDWRVRHDINGALP